MFHRMNGGVIQPQSKKDAQTKYQVQGEPPKTGMSQTAVQPYRKPQEEVFDNYREANHSDPTYDQRKKQEAVSRLKNKIINQPKTNQLKTKEARIMNNPQQKNLSQENQQQSSAPSQPQARVDIPGNNFQRPGAIQGRPSYPGASYPGASASASTGYTPQSSNASSARQLSIGPGITMSGEIESCDHLLVEGTVEAALKGASILEIAETGSYFGTVEIEEATIAGRFEGDITVRGRLTIESAGVVMGSISYGELAIEAGATLEGSISPIGSENSSMKQSGAKKVAPAKAKKVSQDNGQELPFADRAAAE